MVVYCILPASVKFVSRLWAIYIFVKESLVQISGSTFMLSGLEEFIVPQLEK
jgi:hypothetical protein